MNIYQCKHIPATLGIHSTLYSPLPWAYTSAFTLSPVGAREKNQMLDFTLVHQTSNFKISILLQFQHKNIIILDFSPTGYHVVKPIIRYCNVETSQLL